MKLMFIEKLLVVVLYFKNVASQSAADGVGHQKIVAVDAIFVGGEFNSDHDLPPSSVYRLILVPARTNRAYMPESQESRLQTLICYKNGPRPAAPEPFIP